jgi:carbonic anhydrase
MKKVLLAVSLTAFAGLSFAQGSVKWGYDGNIGPANWGDLSPEFAMCKTGKVQAPIDISTKGLAKVTTPIKTDYSPSKAIVVNNGHTIQVDLPAGGYAML